MLFSNVNDFFNRPNSGGTIFRMMCVHSTQPMNNLLQSTARDVLQNKICMLIFIFPDRVTSVS